MTLGFPDRARSLKRDVPAPVGLLAECPMTVAAICLALDQIGGRDWASYGGWGSHADASMRRGWVHHRRRRMFALATDLMSVFGSGISGGRGGGDQRPGGWLNLVVLPAAGSRGSTIEVRGVLDAEMYESVRSVLRSLFVTIVRVWDPTVA